MIGGSVGTVKLEWLGFRTFYHLCIVFLFFFGRFSSLECYIFMSQWYKGLGFPLCSLCNLSLTSVCSLAEASFFMVLVSFFSNLASDRPKHGYDGFSTGVPSTSVFISSMASACILSPSLSFFRASTTGILLVTGISGTVTSTSILGLWVR